MTGRQLESRRLALVAKIALQRIELRGHLRGARSHGALSATLKGLHAAKVAMQWWAVARLAWRLATALRGRRG
jgi:hypothetical protein